MWELIDNDLLTVDLPVAVYLDPATSLYAGWYLGKPDAPVYPTHILWDIDDTQLTGLLGDVTFIVMGAEFGPIPERKVSTGIKFVPAEVTGYTGTFTTESNAETQAEVSLSGDWIITTVYVKADAAGTGSGIDWTNAMTDLNNAVNKARDEVIPNVFIAYGTYTPSESQEPGKGPRFRSFRMYNNITIKGSFTGNILDPEEQDPGNPSILSGDLGTDNCYHVLFIPDNQGLDSTAVMEDLVISDGRADRYRGIEHSVKGGGVYCGTGNAPVFSYVTVQNNTAVNGGGIYIKEALPVLDSCSVTDNSAVNGGGIYYDNCSYETASAIVLDMLRNTAEKNGGGIYNNNSAVIIQSLLCNYNTAVFNGGGYFQKGPDASGSIELAFGFLGSSVSYNKAVTGGGINISGGVFSIQVMGIYSNKAVSGGGIFCDDSSLTVKDGTFYNNFAVNGGGALSRNSYFIADKLVFQLNKAMNKGGGLYLDKNIYDISANSVYVENTAGYGAGIYMDRSDTVVAGITAVRNSAEISGGFIYGRQCTSEIRGCAMQDNTPHGKQITGDRFDYILKAPAMHLPGQIFEVITEGDRIETTDLGFADYSGNDLVPVPGSVLEGASDLSYFPEGLQEDIVGTVRNSAGFTNIGAYESIL